MAGDRGRDLTFSILSDTDQLDLVRPARELDQLGQAAVDAGRDLERIDATDAARELGQLEDASTRTARKMDDAFEKIARASKSSATRMDDNTDRMKRSLDDVNDEASGTAREMAASFDGSADSVMDAFQELGANAGEAFGPIAGAVGVAATVGVGLIRAGAEELRETASSMVDEMIEAGGRLTEAAVNAKIEQMASDDPGAFAAQKKLVDELGLSWRDFARAKAGDGEAAERSIQQMADLNDKLTEQAAAAGSASGQMAAQQTILNDLAGQVSTTAEAYKLAEAAVIATGDATADTDAQVSGAKEGWDNLRESMTDPVTGKIRLNTPGSTEYSRVRAAIQRGVGVIPVQLRVTGQNVFTNNANNSRYRN